MGRCFSTVYRIVLVIASLVAVVLTIMSATSCAFVKFDHQYGGDRRSLQGVTGTTLGATGTSIPGVADPADAVTAAVAAPGDDTAGVDPADAAATVSTSEAAGGTNPPATATATAAGDDAAGSGTDPTKATATTEGDAFVAAVDTATAEFDTATSAAGDALAAAVESTAASVAPEGEPVPAASAVDTTAAADPTAPKTKLPPVEVPISSKEDEGLAKGEFPWAELNEDGGSTSEDTASALGASSSSSVESVEAQVSGDAGLFCDGQKSFSVTNLWGGTIAEFEEEIATESDMNQSEELARNAVIMAAVFGSFAAVILIIEGVLGWRMWCERWIIGIVSIMACVSQGITFLFFNSERYCDGDIVNEIINQKPCVVGQGGVYSITALVLYVVMVVMSCRLPKDDPYGLCCKKNDSSAQDSTTSAGGSGKFGLLGGGSKGGSETFKGSNGGTDDDPRRERPNWLSEDARKEAVEGGEDEII